MSRVRSSGTAGRPTRLRIGWQTDVGGYVNDLPFSPDERLLAVGCEDGTLAVFSPLAARP